MARRRTRKSKEQLELPVAVVEDASLAEVTQRRYLNYALSVITSRALPDVRDGLKPVQRRILYTMQNELHLRHDAKYRKSAAIVGDVMGKFHPHGDSAIYDALARMAQTFSMRVPLVDGRGNFGSPDGDPPAAMRYTEARLTKLAGELMAELGQRTVSFRPNYDGTRFEPIVLPARFPNMLVNGSYGIAVGMATSIPPHNLGEVIAACILLIDKPTSTLKSVLRKIKGPDFPTGGELLASRDELLSIYESGSGSIPLRGTWKLEDVKGRRGAKNLVITSIPFAVERGSIVAKIGEIVAARKLPHVVDVRDESTEECRIVCELKKDADPDLVMAYLFKNTPLKTNVQLNLTCLVPTDNPEIAAPQRLDLLSVLRYFLDFRMEVVTKRLEFQLEKLRERIHILEGFETVFDALDETIRIIRRSEGKKDAAAKLMKRFDLDAIQVDAILELKLYKLAKLEILLIQKELDEKRKEAKRIERLLEKPAERWKLIREELSEIEKEYADRRAGRRSSARTRRPSSMPRPSSSTEDAMVVLTRAGVDQAPAAGARRVDDARARRRRGLRGRGRLHPRRRSRSSRTAGVCYVCRINDVPATTGYGVPMQTLFKMADGERIVAMMGFDPRFLDVPEPSEGAEEPEEPYAVAVTRKGYTARFSLRGHREPSTRAGRKYCPAQGGRRGGLRRATATEEDRIACATREGRALICNVDETSACSRARGKGVMLIKLQKSDAVVGAAVLADDSDMLVVQNDNGKELTISTRKYEVVSRGGKGFRLFKRGKLDRVVWGEPTLPGFPAPEDEE